MTVISEPVADIGGADNNTVFTFSVPLLRESDTGLGLVTTRTLSVTAKAGILTTPDLDVGPAKVMVGLRAYGIEIPDSPTPIRLWPLIQAGLPIPPEQEVDAVRNLGGIRGEKTLELDDYLAIPTPDPETLYFVPE